MADVYSRVTSRVGVCEGPSGGGATYIASSAGCKYGRIETAAEPFYETHHIVYRQACCLPQGCRMGGMLVHSHTMAPISGQRSRRTDADSITSLSSVAKLAWLPEFP